VHAILFPFSGYRAWVQVRDVTLRANDAALAPGSKLIAAVTTSGRIPIEVDIVMSQGALSRKLGTTSIPANSEAIYDPRFRHDSLVVMLDSASLAGFAPGSATARATARSRRQFTRIPPPVVSEITVAVAAR
jgi:hypothetical protein